MRVDDPVAQSLALKHWSHMQKNQEATLSPERQWRFNRYNKYNNSKLIAQSHSKPSAITNLSSSFVSSGSLRSQQNHYAALKFR